MPSITLTVTAPDGSIHYRKTTVEYSHAIMALKADGTWKTLSFHKSERHANNRIKRLSKIIGLKACSIKTQHVIN